MWRVDVLEYEGESQADLDFWATNETEPELRARIEELRPPRPFWISPSNPESMTRWAAAWRLAAVYALAIGAHTDGREQRQFVWFEARSLYQSDLPTL